MIVEMLGNMKIAVAILTGVGAVLAAVGAVLMGWMSF